MLKAGNGRVSPIGIKAGVRFGDRITVSDSYIKKIKERTYSYIDVKCKCGRVDSVLCYLLPKGKLNSCRSCAQRKRFGVPEASIDGERYCTGHKSYHPVEKFIYKSTPFWCNEYKNENKRKRTLSRKTLAYERLGNACACCGFNKDPLTTLTLGHPNNDGKAHREFVSSKGPNGIIGHLLRTNFECDGFEVRLECWGCNMCAQTSGKGKCPYEGREHPWIDNEKFVK